MRQTHGFYSLPYILYNIRTREELGLFKECRGNAIYFHRRFELNDIHFLKPVDSFVQPPELESADKIVAVNNCEDFDKHVIQVNTSGFLIYKDKLTGTFHRICMKSGCAINYYSYSELPISPSFVDFFRTPVPFGFFWREWFNDKTNLKMIYQKCDNGKLKFVLHQNGMPLLFEETFLLSNLTFYNIQPENERLDYVKLHLNHMLISCEEFYNYLKDPMNILNGYIYFSDSGYDALLVNYAMKVNIYGPETLREKPYLLNYKHTINGYVRSYSPPWLFVGCVSKSINSSFVSDSLRFERDSDTNKVFFMPLLYLTFYNPDLDEDESDIETRHKLARIKLHNHVLKDELGLEMKVLKGTNFDN